MATFVPHQGIRHINGTDTDAWLPQRCGHCGRDVNMAVVSMIMENAPGMQFTVEPRTWLECNACGEPSVIPSDGELIPGVKKGLEIGGLPPDVAKPYDEARRCMQVNAFTATELICRKILMHVAVDRAGAAQGDSFASYIDSLRDAGYVTPPMERWVDLIREHGNFATHELPPSDEARAESTLMFTGLLLRLVYEVEHEVDKYTRPPAQGQP